MWIAKARVRHDCVIGNRCQKYKVQTIGGPFSIYIKNEKTYAPQLQTIYGKEENIQNFIDDLKKDSRVHKLEHQGNSIFFVEERKDAIPSSFYEPKLVFAKPVVVDTEGYEYWELASWEKENLKMQRTKLKDVYFQHLSPDLTFLQKQSLQIAIQEGYYNYPRKTELRKLAQLMKISLATYREHLRKAEHKILPDLLAGLK
ncbi:helix-turn-helix domain-containing protein [Candidatus Woesearchaeota archaeon]|nr:helix-turn-helix domain-containing protein [Candidatus Woesearchaeota archaeon]